MELPARLSQNLAEKEEPRQQGDTEKIQEPTYLLHEVEKFPYEKFSPEGESLTAELFRRGLSRQKLGKVDRPKQVPPEILLEPEWQFRITPCVFRIQRKTIDGSTASALAFTSFL